MKLMITNLALIANLNKKITEDDIATFLQYSVINHKYSLINFNNTVSFFHGLPVLLTFLQFLRNVFKPK